MKISLDFDELNMSTQITLYQFIGSLRLEMTDDIGERGGIPRCGVVWLDCLGEDCVVCKKEQQEVEAALRSTVTQHERAI